MTISSVAAPFSGTQTGTLTDLKRGAETFLRTVANQNGTRTVDTTYTLANGQQVTQDVTRTKTATGYTRDVTTTLADGKTTTLNETATKQADGSFAITGSYVGRDGQTETVSGTNRHQSGQNVTDLSFTNAAHQTRTLDTTSAGTLDQQVRAVQGTTFGGVSFADSSALAVLQSQAA